jgi:hypothetical protein
MEVADYSLCNYISRKKVDGVGEAYSKQRSSKKGVSVNWEDSMGDIDQTEQRGHTKSQETISSPGS